MEVTARKQQQEGYPQKVVHWRKEDHCHALIPW
jgi:hypothetical protein